ncbi:MAG TPA: hypothetical protein VLV76_26380 [Candidatus Acidoferrum sp.]|nr:hypothetical protein [Candidatus Acidoferrum sp.]
MSDPRPAPPASREFVFRTIRLLMLADIVAGGVLIVLGWFVLDMQVLAIAGAFLACMGIGLTILFSLLARRAAEENRKSPHQLRR